MRRGSRCLSYFLPSADTIPAPDFGGIQSAANVPGDDGARRLVWIGGTDPACDGIVSDVVDVVTTVNVSFRGAPPVWDPGCSYERTDVNADGAVDVLDVAKVVNVAFRGQTIAANYIKPCQ